MTRLRTQQGLEYLLATPSPASDERGYVMRSMTHQLRTVPGYRELPNRELTAHFSELERRWDDPTCIRLLALDPEDPWLVLGFVLGGPRVLTWLHVRGGYRGFGLATSLASELGIMPGVPSAVEFLTWDLIREPRDTRAGLPIGLLHSANWRLTALPWRPED